MAGVLQKNRQLHTKVWRGGHHIGMFSNASIEFCSLAMPLCRPLVKRMVLIWPRSFGMMVLLALAPGTDEFMLEHANTMADTDISALGSLWTIPIVASITCLAQQLHLDLTRQVWLERDRDNAQYYLSSCGSGLCHCEESWTRLPKKHNGFSLVPCLLAIKYSLPYVQTYLHALDDSMIDAMSDMLLLLGLIYIIEQVKRHKYKRHKLLTKSKTLTCMELHGTPWTTMQNNCISVFPHVWPGSWTVVILSRPRWTYYLTGAVPPRTPSGVANKEGLQLWRREIQVLLLDGKLMSFRPALINNGTAAVKNTTKTNKTLRCFVCFTGTLIKKDTSQILLPEIFTAEAVQTEMADLVVACTGVTAGTGALLTKATTKKMKKRKNWESSTHQQTVTI